MLQGSGHRHRAGVFWRRHGVVELSAGLADQSADGGALEATLQAMMPPGHEARIDASDDRRRSDGGRHRVSYRRFRRLRRRNDLKSRYNAKPDQIPIQ